MHAEQDANSEPVESTLTASVISSRSDDGDNGRFLAEEPSAAPHEFVGGKGGETDSYVEISPPKSNPSKLGPVGQIARRTSRVAERLSADIASSFGDGDGDISRDGSDGKKTTSVSSEGSDAINAGGIGSLTNGGRSKGGKMVRRTSRSAEALSNLASSLGINAFDPLRLERELGVDSGGKKPETPRMAASGKANPFRGKPFRYENVHGKTQVLVHDDAMWRNFKAELDASGVKTGVGVKMVLLKFVKEHLPGDEATTRAALEALWKRKKLEDHLAYGKMRHAISSPSLFELAGGGGGGIGFGGERRSSNATNASMPAHGAGLGGPGVRPHRMSFRSAQSAPFHEFGHGSSSNLASLADIPSKIFGGNHGGEGGDDAGSIATFGNLSFSSLASEMMTAENGRSSDQASSVGKRKSGGHLRRRSRGSLGSFIWQQQEQEQAVKPGKGVSAATDDDDDIARAAAIVAATDLGDSSHGSEVFMSGSADVDSGERANDCCDDNEIMAATAALSELDIEDDEAGVTSKPKHDFVLGLLNDMQDDDIDDRQLQPEEGNDVEGLPNGLAGESLGRPGRQRRRQSFGTLSNVSLGTMPIGDITIEEELDEDLSSCSSEEEWEGRGKHSGRDRDADEKDRKADKARDEGGEFGADDANVGIAIASEGFSSHLGEVVVAYRASSECRANSELGDVVALSEYGDAAKVDKGSGDYAGLEEQGGYIDNEGNVNVCVGIHGQDKQMESMYVPPPNDRNDQDGIATDLEERHDNFDEEDNNEGRDGFILSFPSPEERDVIRRSIRQVIGESENEELVDDNHSDNDDEPRPHFPPPEEREKMGRCSSRTWAGPQPGIREDEDEENEENGFDGNASTQTWSGWSTGTEDCTEEGLSAVDGKARVGTPFDASKSEGSLWRDRGRGGCGGMGSEKGKGWFGLGGNAGNAENDDEKDSGRGRARRSKVGKRGDKRRRDRRHQARKRPNDVQEEIQKIMTRVRNEGK